MGECNVQNKWCAVHQWIRTISILVIALCSVAMLERSDDRRDGGPRGQRGPAPVVQQDAPVDSR
jgi:hypothetical protein